MLVCFSLKKKLSLNIQSVQSDLLEKRIGVRGKARGRNVMELERGKGKRTMITHLGGGGEV